MNNLYTTVEQDTEIDHKHIVYYNICGYCGMPVSQCSNVDCQHEFKKREDLYCSPDGFHYCKECNSENL